MPDDDRRPRQLDEVRLRLSVRELEPVTLVDAVSVFPREKSASVVADLDRRYYPEEIRSVALELRAYTNGAFSITYREDWESEAWMRRRGRHADPHSARDHGHRPPQARTADAVDCEHPADFFDVIETVVGEVDARLGDVRG